MLDVRDLRADPERARASQRSRGDDPQLVDALLSADDARRAALTDFEQARAEQRTFGREVATAKGDERVALLARSKDLAARVKELQAAAAAHAAEVDRIQWQIANIVLPGVPAGGEDDYVVLKAVGAPRDFEVEGIEIRDHLELGEGLGAIDTARGVKVSGSRFYFLTGVGALLELALTNLAITAASAAGFVPVITPTLVKPEIMAGTGFLGAHADEIYHLEADDLYLVGTSEVALAGFHSGEIIDLGDGPKRYAGYSTCYRREAGSYGKDTRGIIRVHQFTKVEMFCYVRQEDAAAEHKRLLAFQEQMLAAIDVPYRVIDTAAGDLGSSAARKFDCEAWLPSQKRFLELTSTSNCTTFQARRLDVRERHGEATRPVATLNGTLATTRWIVAILENHQQADGSVLVPEALRPWLGGQDVLKPVSPTP